MSIDTCGEKSDQELIKAIVQDYLGSYENDDDWYDMWGGHHLRRCEHDVRRDTCKLCKQCDTYDISVVPSSRRKITSTDKDLAK